MLNNYSLIFSRESRHLIRLALLENKNRIGLVRFSTPPEPLTKSVYLNSIEIAKTYRNKNIGSRLLNKMELYLTTNTEVENIMGMLWNDNTNPYLEEFFIKNDYLLKYDERSFYDNGEDIIECVPLFKKL
jgi:ribosomal protein S18 acetylase RimI-like enzyme